MLRPLSPRPPCQHTHVFRVCVCAHRWWMGFYLCFARSPGPEQGCRLCCFWLGFSFLCALVSLLVWAVSLIESWTLIALELYSVDFLKSPRRFRIHSCAATKARGQLKRRCHGLCAGSLVFSSPSPFLFLFFFLKKRFFLLFRACLYVSMRLCACAYVCVSD